MKAAGAAPHGAPMPESPVRICMWSGPRNLSTALMRSFGNRSDCGVADEVAQAQPIYDRRAAHTLG